MKREIVVMCGVSHSGKTTYAKNRYPKYRYINSDEIRIGMFNSRKISNNESVVWSMFSRKKFDAINKGENIVLDACHISSTSRYHALNGVPSNYKKVLVLMDTSKKVLMKRVEKEKRIDFGIVESMINSFLKPTANDGFDKIIVVKTTDK